MAVDCAGRRTWNQQDYPTEQTLLGATDRMDPGSDVHFSQPSLLMRFVWSMSTGGIIICKYWTTGTQVPVL